MITIYSRVQYWQGKSPTAKPEHIPYNRVHWRHCEVMWCRTAQVEAHRGSEWLQGGDTVEERVHCVGEVVWKAELGALLFC